MLEKILEEIDAYIKVYNEPPFGRAVEGTAELLERCKDIIRKHTNDGWIPVEDGMPEVDEGTEDDYCPEFNVTIRDVEESTTLKFSPDGTWFDENGYCYDVIAWQPLPEAYRAEKGKLCTEKTDG